MPATEQGHCDGDVRYARADVGSTDRYVEKVGQVHVVAFRPTEFEGSLMVKLAAKS